MEALDSDGNECPVCLTHIIRILPYPQFFTCGCAICPDCIDEAQQCPTHTADLYSAQDSELIAKVQEITQLYQLYERSYTDDRSALDDLVMRVRDYVRRTGVQVEYVACAYCGQRVTPKGQTHCYSCSNPLVRQTWQCPHCYEYSEQGRCWKCENQGYQTPQYVPQAYAQPVAAYTDAQVYQPAARVNARQSEPASLNADWLCQKCNRRNYKTATNCAVCNNPKATPTAQTQDYYANPVVVNRQTWQCPTCHEYSAEGKCWKCKVQTYQPAPVPQPAAPIATLGEDWICQKCQTKNYKTATKCTRCYTPKAIPTRVNIAPRAVYRSSRQ